MHPIYRDPDQKLLFLSLEDLLQAIEEFYDGNARIGDFSPYARGFNYFNDFNGPKRVAVFIKGYMNSCKKCIPREEELESAVDEYFRANGVRMSFYQNTNWYGDSL